jgi:hypothetical protein
MLAADALPKLVKIRKVFIPCVEETLVEAVAHHNPEVAIASPDDRQ